MDNRNDDTARYPWLGKKLMWLENAKNLDRLFYALCGMCALLFVADFLYKKKTYLSAEGIPGFYAIYGFVACALIVVIAKGVRILLKRDDSYYAPNDVETEEYPEAELGRENVND